jgi:hypothetical protein
MRRFRLPVRLQAEKEVGIFRNEDNANDSRGPGSLAKKITDNSAIPTRHLGRRSKEWEFKVLETGSYGLIQVRRQQEDFQMRPSLPGLRRCSRCARMGGFT